MSDVQTRTTALTQRRRVLADRLGVVVEDFRCTAHVHPKGPEEVNLKHSIVFIRRGVFIRQRGKESVVADANYILFFNAGEPYRIAHPVPGGDDCTILSIPSPLALELVARHLPQQEARGNAPFPFGFALSPPRAARLQLELLRKIRSPAEAALDEVLIELMETAVRAAGATHCTPWGGKRLLTAATARRHRELADAAKVGISSSVGNAPSLTGLARALGCSAFHLSRVFRAQVGLNLRTYYARLRTRLAADKLSGGERDLTGLALDLGYADHSHFTNAFRKEWGLPPSAVRAQHVSN